MQEVGTEAVEALVRVQLLERQHFHYRSVVEHYLGHGCRQTQPRKARFLPQNLTGRPDLPRPVLHRVRVHDPATRKVEHQVLPMRLNERQPRAQNIACSLAPTRRDLNCIDTLSHQLSQCVAPARHRMSFRHVTSQSENGAAHH